MLKASPGVPLISDRGVPLTWDPDQVTDVSGVVVINYTPPEDYIAVLRGGLPKSAILLTDWQELSRALGSTAALVDLLMWRTSETLDVPLGDELDTLGTALDHDLSGQSGLPPDDIQDGWNRLQKRHPDFRYGSSKDHENAAVVAAIVAQVHDYDPEWGSPPTPTTYLYIAEALERMSRERAYGRGTAPGRHGGRRSPPSRPRRPGRLGRHLGQHSLWPPWRTYSSSDTSGPPVISTDGKN